MSAATRRVAEPLRSVVTEAFPRGSDRHLFLQLAVAGVKKPTSLKRRLTAENRFLRKSFADFEFACNICEHQGSALYQMPDMEKLETYRIARLRESLRCRGCHSSMRDRTLAAALLEVMRDKHGVDAGSIRALAQRLIGQVRVYDTDAHSTISQELAGRPGYLRSVYQTGYANGQQIGAGLFNMDLQDLTFPDQSFDIILTSDVMEHVRDDAAAHREIARCLKPGGTYLFTVPYDDTQQRTRVLVDTTTDADIPLEPLHLHGDPVTSYIVAYRIYGRDLLSDLAVAGFDAAYRPMSVPSAAIFDGDVFVAHRLPAADVR
jgi:SAM-dependent methyltransferase